MKMLSTKVKESLLNFFKSWQLKLSGSSCKMFCQVFSLMIDETTDVAVLNEMVIYTRYLLPGSNKVTTTFLKICELFNGTADTIETTLRSTAKYS